MKDGRVMEAHYTVQHLALLVCKSDRYIRECMKRGEFGPHVFLVERDYIVTASAANAWLEHFRLNVPDSPVWARCEGEARRKVEARLVAA